MIAVNCEGQTSASERCIRAADFTLEGSNGESYSVCAEHATDRMLAEVLREAEASGDGDIQAAALNEIAARIKLPPEHVEQGLTEHGNAEVERFLYRAAGEGHKV